MKITRCFFLVGLIAVLTITMGCQKGGGGSGTTEENLVVETIPLANGHVEAPSTGPNFPLKVNIKSAMPSGGVKIDVTAKPDGGTVSFFSNSATTKSTDTDFSITGATAGITSIVEITVTSVSKSTNKWSGSYKFSRK